MKTVRFKEKLDQIIQEYQHPSICMMKEFMKLPEK